MCLYSFKRFCFSFLFSTGDWPPHIQAINLLFELHLRSFCFHLFSRKGVTTFLLWLACLKLEMLCLCLTSSWATPASPKCFLISTFIVLLSEKIVSIKFNFYRFVCDLSYDLYVPLERMCILQLLQECSVSVVRSILSRVQFHCHFFVDLFVWVTSYCIERNPTCQHY